MPLEQEAALGYQHLVAGILSDREVTAIESWIILKLHGSEISTDRQLVLMLGFLRKFSAVHFAKKRRQSF